MSCNVLNRKNIVCVILLRTLYLNNSTRQWQANTDTIHPTPQTTNLQGEPATPAPNFETLNVEH